MIEQWKPVPGYGGFYEASNQGRIRSKDRFLAKKLPNGRIWARHVKGRLMSLYEDGGGDRLAVRLVHEGIGKSVFVHKLVLLAFVGPCPQGMECCHWNGVASDNRLLNLRWDTHYENVQDQKRHGTGPKGERHPMTKFSNADITAMRCMQLRDAIVEFGISRSHFFRIRNREARTDAP